MEPLYLCSWWDIHDSRLSHVGTQYNSTTHGSGRALFGDWGRLGNVNISYDCDDVNVYTQYENQVSYRKTTDPFYCKEDFQTNKSELKSNIHLFIAEREVTLNKHYHFRQILNRGLRRNQIDACKRFVENVDKGISMLKLEVQAKISAPISMIYAADTYSHLLSPESLRQACQMTSSMYSGGCIKLFTLNEITFIARCGGPCLSTLRIDRYNRKHCNLTKVYETKAECISPIYEINVNVIAEQCQLLIRRANELRLYTVVSDGSNGVSVKKVGRFKKNKNDEAWLSARLNHRWSEEIVATSDTAIYNYDVVTMKPTWQMILPTVTDVVDSWSEVQSLLPMQWVHTSRTHCSLIDCREKDTGKVVNELFAVTDPCWSKAETFCHSSAIFNSHFFYLMSSFNGCLIDVRMPHKHVNQWTVPLLNPVSYSSLTAVSTDTIQCVIGCQMQAGHCLFDQTVTNHSQTISLRSTSVSDESPMSLGLATISDNDDITSVLTLTHEGAVLCHQYTQSSNESNNVGNNRKKRRHSSNDRSIIPCAIKNDPMKNFKWNNNYDHIRLTDTQIRNDIARAKQSLLESLTDDS